MARRLGLACAGARAQAPVDKRDRAELLLLALASLLLRGGERVRADARRTRAPSPAASGLDRLADDLERGRTTTTACRRRCALPRHATRRAVRRFPVAAGARSRRLIGRFAAVPVTGYLLQVLDPAEAAAALEGRVRFRGLEQDGDALIPRVESVRDAYADRLEAQQEGLAAICAAAGFGFAVHRTDHPPETALLALYAALRWRAR